MIPHAINVIYLINKIKDKSPTIISIDTEKATAKIQQTFMITKILNKLGTEGAYLIIIKAIYEKPTANIIFKGKRLKASPLRSGRQMLTLTTLSPHSIESSS